MRAFRLEEGEANISIVPDLQYFWRIMQYGLRHKPGMEHRHDISSDFWKLWVEDELYRKMRLTEQAFIRTLVSSSFAGSAVHPRDDEIVRVDRSVYSGFMPPERMPLVALSHRWTRYNALVLGGDVRRTFEREEAYESYVSWLSPNQTTPL
ncbi:MAG: hypothetical protein ACP5I3_11500 [Thermoproteus sp.]